MNPYENIIPLDASELRAAISYVPETGDLIWIETDRPASKLWRAANGKAYRYVVWKGKWTRAHRIAWCIHHGSISNAMCVDHINGNGADNRIKNLRLVPVGENAKNQRLPRTNTSGRIGVSWRKDCGKYQALAKRDGKRIHLGYFETLEAAGAARKEFEAENGYHPNHGMERPL